MENHPPRLMICFVEFLASEEVLFIIFEAVCIHFAGAQCTAGLSPCTSGKKTIVAIDEAQVRIGHHNWSLKRPFSSKPSVLLMMVFFLVEIKIGG